MKEVQCQRHVLPKASRIIPCWFNYSNNITCAGIFSNTERVQTTHMLSLSSGKIQDEDGD
jgi:hypothetical protein